LGLTVALRVAGRVKVRSDAAMDAFRCDAHPSTQGPCHSTGGTRVALTFRSPFRGVPMMYHAYQAQSDLLRPLRQMAKVHGAWLGTEPPRPGLADMGRPAMAASKVFELAEVTHRRPAWRIDEVMVDGEPQPVVEEVVARTPFAELLRFSKPGAPAAPP